MAVKFGNRVKETTTTTGTGTLTLGGADTGFRGFADEFTTNDDEISYLIVDNPNNPIEYEYGKGTFVTGTFERDTVEGSSNSGSKVDFGAGIKTIIAAPTAGDFTPFTSVISARGDLIRGSSTATAEKLALGTTGQIVGSDGTDLVWADRHTIGTPDDATGSPSTITFTGIPAWVKQFTLTLSRFSTSGTSSPLIQLGDAGGLETSGYLGTGGQAGTGIATANFTVGFGLQTTSWASNFVMSGFVTFTLVDSSTNTWVCHGNLGRSEGAAINFTAGYKALSAALDRVAITTVGGSDTIDGDSVINIEY